MPTSMFDCSVSTIFFLRIRATVSLTSFAKRDNLSATCHMRPYSLIDRQNDYQRSGRVEGKEFKTAEYFLDHEEVERNGKTLSQVFDPVYSHSLCIRIFLSGQQFGIV